MSLFSLDDLPHRHALREFETSGSSHCPVAAAFVPDHRSEIAEGGPAEVAMTGCRSQTDPENLPTCGPGRRQTWKYRLS